MLFYRRNYYNIFFALVRLLKDVITSVESGNNTFFSKNAKLTIFLRQICENNINFLVLLLTIHLNTKKMFRV